MDLDFFKKVRILDGGMGQELLARGMKPKGTLWSASALLDEKYHKLLFDTHLDFIRAGAEVIITTTFASRKMRLKENNCEDKFEYINKKAGQIAQKTKDNFPNVIIGGGLPPQNYTYRADTRSNDEIKNDFNSQAKLINPYIDFFYFDVLVSINEIKLGIESIKEFNKPYLVGVHISEGTKLPSGEKISELRDSFDTDKLLGLTLSCVSPENFELNINEIKNLGMFFGFKLNGFIKTNPIPKFDKNKKTENPNKLLGIRKDLTPKKMSKFAKKFKDEGATIIGGCCETRPQHIKEMARLIKII